ncbi:ABC transporter substrate-binding protein [Pedobacter frigidisoli]|uniref:ABC transporter substrate-binding protein n=1 Tax=Pedobacter frigidisoli TaxID=2530455 RepID=A0A4R0NCR5_9SPHI|nr:ABC transporter substrate-binding protein [Pedobacter frigidisoli]TCC98131.1 ABC transporter substrate-binding protein [Pedobacter frigidisoli]
MDKIKLIANLLTVSIILISSTVSAQKVLKYSDHEPLGGMCAKFLKEIFFPAMERESNGRLKIEAHWNGELAIAYNELGAIRRGDTVDVATVVPEYTPKELPLHQIFKSFPAGPSGNKQVKFFRQVYSQIPEFSTELSNNYMVEIFLSTGYPVGFFSRTPLANLNNIKGSRWRTASLWHADFLSNIGAIPVTMHWGPEIYKALEQKLDGILLNVDSGFDLKVHEHAPYLLASKDLWLGYLYLVSMNKAIWNNLAKEDQEAIQRAAKFSYKSLGNVMDKSFDSQIQTQKKEGAIVRLLSRPEVKEFKCATKYQEIQQEWAIQQKANTKEVQLVFEKIKTILK